MKNAEVTSKNIAFPERDFKKSAQKSWNLHFGSVEHLRYFACSRGRILYAFCDFHPETRLISTGTCHATCNFHGCALEDLPARLRFVQIEEFT